MENSQFKFYLLASESIWEVSYTQSGWWLTVSLLVKDTPHHGPVSADFDLWFVWSFLDTRVSTLGRKLYISEKKTVTTPVEINMQ